MKFVVLIFFLISTLTLNAHSKENSILKGTWQLADFICETETGTGPYPLQNPILNTQVKPKKIFKDDGQYSDEVTIPLGPQTTCNTQGIGTYNVAENMLFIQMTSVTSKDCPGLVSAFNEDLKTNGLFFNEYKIQNETKLLLYQPLKAGETDFNCGRDKRVIEVWVKL